MPVSNPVLIQDAPRTRDELPPLFLIHDASGLVNSYFRLGPLARNRRVYGIWDPKLDLTPSHSNPPSHSHTHAHHHESSFLDTNTNSWPSIPAIALHYIHLIRKVYPRGPLVLGGWSFGGIVAVAMAHTLASRPAVARGLRCTGIVLVDSVYPRCDTRPEVRRLKTAAGARHAPHLPNVAPETRQRLLEALARATALSDRWEPPAWEPRDLNEKTECMNVGGLDGLGKKPLPVPPPVVLIRAPDWTPTERAGEVCPLDRTRFLPLLGWEDMQEGFVSGVLETTGGHYTVFDAEHVPSITRNLQKALDMCSRGARY